MQKLPSESPDTYKKQIRQGENTRPRAKANIPKPTPTRDMGKASPTYRPKDS